MRSIFVLALFAAVLMAVSALVACEQVDEKESDFEVLDGSGDYGSVSQPIVNGDPPDAPEHEAVVGLHQLARGGNSVYVLPFCSGTLIAPDVVITAAHCLDTAKGWSSTFSTISPSKLAIYVGDDPASDIVDHLYRVSETVIYPGYDRIQLHNDLGLVRLSTPVTEPVSPVPHLPASIGFTGADIGTLLNFAGFGDDENGVHGVKLQADVALGGFGCSVPGCGDAGVAATQISYTQSAAGPCFGDSGGPAFVYRSSAPYVGGLTSYGDSNCTVYGVSTRVDAFEAYINDFISPAPPPPPDCSADGTCNGDCAPGEDPDCAPPPPPGCGNGTCDAGESCDGRYGTVACPSDCAGKTNGKPNARYCYVGGACEGPGCP
ncbi:MAG: trypsin-like serine protease [Deltaproteobacteria bacterium]|nr:trypsin-like serine protease [Deltaproteobacteria bacterium]